MKLWEQAWRGEPKFFFLFHTLRTLSYRAHNIHRTDILRTWKRRRPALSVYPFRESRKRKFVRKFRESKGLFLQLRAATENDLIDQNTETTPRQRPRANSLNYIPAICLPRQISRLSRSPLSITNWESSSRSSRKIIGNRGLSRHNSQLSNKSYVQSAQIKIVNFFFFFGAVRYLWQTPALIINIRFRWSITRGFCAMEVYRRSYYRISR